MDKTFLLNNLLKSDGTNQSQRTLPALLPDYIKIDEQGIGDLLLFTYQLAKQINFFDVDGTTADWHSFFGYFIDPTTDSILYSDQDIVTIMAGKSDFSPDFALFLTFIQLFQFAQKDINAITSSHLDFYYTQVLQLQKKGAAPDSVNLVLTLTSNLPNYLLAAGTTFKGPKESNGLTPVYSTDSEIVINQAQITGMKSLFIDAANGYRIYSADVANSADGEGKEFTTPGSEWAAFGSSQKGLGSQDRTMSDAAIGFGFCSPMLLLAEGTRTITLTIAFQAETGPEIFSGNITNNVQIWLSGAKDWIQPSVFSAVIQPLGSPTGPMSLVITVNLASTDPAVVPYASTLSGPVFNTPWPVLKVSLNSAAVLYTNLYDYRIASGTIDVAVNGIKNLVIQNSQSQLNPGKPFQPWGSMPAVGSEFYIGSAEVFQKQLTSLAVDVLWNEVPQAQLGGYYANYFDTSSSISNTVFTADINMLYRNQWVRLVNTDPAQGTTGPAAGGSYYLFDPSDATILHEMAINATELSSALAPLDYTRTPALQQLTTFDNTTQDGFIVLSITGPVLSSSFPFSAFGQNQYPNIYAARAIKIATGTTATLPNPPYTPTIKTLALNYTSTQPIDFTGTGSLEQFFHLEPFGAATVDPAAPYLFPQYRNETMLPQAPDNTQLYQGNFFLGIGNLVPPENISFLFQVAEGSSDTSVIINNSDIQWSYLASDRWIPIEPLDILSNTTNGFQTSGIIAFTIGSDATKDNMLLPAGSYWIRGSVAANPAGISQFTNVMTQAVQATYVLPTSTQGGALASLPSGLTPAEQLAALTDEHLAAPLPAQRISSAVVRNPSIKTISQPYESFNGNPGEGATSFYTRVSERLRHKGRSLTLWDYERIILDGFPSIFKVKCLTHTDENTDLAPGYVSAVVVPNLLNRNYTNPLQPTANLVTLENISTYMQGFMPPWVNFIVDNPVYEQLLLDFSVGFIAGKDPGFYGNKLNEDLKEFLTPWAYEAGQDIVFGGKIYQSDIIVFIEGLDYVDYVTDFNLYHIFDGEDVEGLGIGSMTIGLDFIISDFIPPVVPDMTIGLDFVVGSSTEVAQASGPRSILVSAPKHRIKVLTGDYACSGMDYQGIGFMAIGVDFVVA